MSTPPKIKEGNQMFWTPELAQYLEDAPWPASKEELIDFANRTGCPQQVLDNLNELEDTDELIESMEDLWPEYEDMSNEEYFYNDNEEEQYY